MSDREAFFAGIRELQAKLGPPAPPPTRFEGFLKTVGIALGLLLAAAIVAAFPPSIFLVGLSIWVLATRND
jgi:hypothetical protein